ncbi:MAG TPA: hypothetical protein VIB08_05615, partial [Thermoanaerobaculia bacterium]
ADPVSDPRHIVLARVLETLWREGKSVDLAGLVALAENPPFRRVGALELDAVLPLEKRRDLALALNNLLSSPGFDAWRAGDSLDFERLRADAKGRPGCNLFYLAHLDDRERLFFVTRFLERFWAWTRTQSGSTELRALLYFDEIFGFLPPVSEPSTKRPLLSLLKQGRAFGVGVLAVTQNPVDLDYKALTNAGTWLVGRLQAERDKERLLDGLEGAGLGMSRAETDKTLSGLEKRRFLLHDVHRPGGAVVFESRWARAYLRGPLTLRQIPDLARGFAEPAPADSARAAAAAKPGAAPPGRDVEPAAPVPPSLDPVFQARYAPGLPSGVRLAGEVAVLVEAQISRQRPAVSGTARKVLRFGSGPAPRPTADASLALDEWETEPPAGATYDPLPAWATKANPIPALERSAKEQTAADGFTLESVPGLGLCRQPAESDADFAARIAAAVEAQAGQCSGRLRTPKERRIATLERQIADETRELERDRAEKSRATAYSAIDVGAGILGAILGGGKRSASSTVRSGGRAYGRIQRAEEDIKESEEKIAAWTRERDDLRAEIESGASAELARLSAAAERREQTKIPIAKSAVRPLGWYVLWVSKS